MIRNLIYDALRHDTVLNGYGINSESVVQADSVDDLPSKPAIVVRWMSTDREHSEMVGQRYIGGSTWPVQLWVHDDPGDYSRIDGIIRRSKDVMGSLVGRLGNEGASIIQADWNSDSQDFRDDGYRTITRFSTYTVAFGWR